MKSIILFFILISFCSCNNDEINELRNRISHLEEENLVLQKLKDSKLSATKWITKLDTLSPLKTLTRGYCLTESEGKLITKAEDLSSGMNVNLRFQDGDKQAIIK